MEISRFGQVLKRKIWNQVMQWKKKLLQIFGSILVLLPHTLSYPPPSVLWEFIWVIISVTWYNNTTMNLLSIVNPIQIIFLASSLQLENKFALIWPMKHSKFLIHILSKEKDWFYHCLQELAHKYVSKVGYQRLGPSFVLIYGSAKPSALHSKNRND